MYAIWNMTNRCPWNCAFCCVASENISAKKAVEAVEKELTFIQKLDILQQLIESRYTVNFSGGDPLYFEEDIRLLEYAVANMPKEAIKVSTTGIDLNSRKLSILCKAGRVTTTLDNLDTYPNPLRSEKYNTSSMNLLKELAKKEANCAAVTVLYPQTIDKKNLIAIQNWLRENGIKNWYILKATAVGRGREKNGLLLSTEQYLSTMDFIESIRGDINVTFQHSLEILRGNTSCHALKKSIGILANGTVTACSWAIDEAGRPLDGFYLGNASKENLDVIIKRAIDAQKFCTQTGCCLPV